MYAGQAEAAKAVTPRLNTDSQIKPQTPNFQRNSTKAQLDQGPTETYGTCVALQSAQPPNSMVEIKELTAGFKADNRDVPLNSVRTCKAVARSCHASLRGERASTLPLPLSFASLCFALSMLSFGFWEAAQGQQQQAGFGRLAGGLESARAHQQYIRYLQRL